MKKTYLKPELEIITYRLADVLTPSYESSIPTENVVVGDGGSGEGNLDGFN